MVLLWVSWFRNVALIPSNYVNGHPYLLYVWGDTLYRKLLPRIIIHTPHPHPTYPPIWFKGKILLFVQTIVLTFEVSRLDMSNSMYVYRMNAMKSLEICSSTQICFCAKGQSEFESYMFT